MAVPRIEDLRKPLLEIVDGAKEDVVPKQYMRLSLTNDDILEKVPSGGQTKFDNCTSWALYELKKVGFLQSPSRAHYQITPQGKELLATGADDLLSLIMERPKKCSATGRR